MKTKTKTVAQAVVGIMLDRRLSAKAREQKLSRLAKRVRDHHEGRVECPDCGHMGPHDDNGAVAQDLCYACAGCGMHLEAPSFLVEE